MAVTGIFPMLSCATAAAAAALQAYLVPSHCKELRSINIAWRHNIAATLNSVSLACMMLFNIGIRLRPLLPHFLSYILA